jgi:hypothetical protein
MSTYSSVNSSIISSSRSFCRIKRRFYVGGISIMLDLRHLQS